MKDCFGSTLEEKVACMNVQARLPHSLLIIIAERSRGDSHLKALEHPYMVYYFGSLHSFALNSDILARFWNVIATIVV